MTDLSLPVPTPVFSNKQIGSRSRRHTSVQCVHFPRYSDFLLNRHGILSPCLLGHKCSHSTCLGQLNILPGQYCFCLTVTWERVLSCWARYMWGAVFFGSYSCYCGPLNEVLSSPSREETDLGGLLPLLTLGCMKEFLWQHGQGWVRTNQAPVPVDGAGAVAPALVLLCRLLSFSLDHPQVLLDDFLVGFSGLLLSRSLVLNL